MKKHILKNYLVSRLLGATVVFISIISIISILASVSFAQEILDKDVHIVKSYEPTISDAFKINILPQIIDTVKVVPLFNYSIQTRQIHTDFHLEPIIAAKMLGEPLTKLYPGYLKIGIGNYWTPFIDINYNKLRSKKYATGVNLMHLSSHGKIKMPGNNDVKVFSGYSDNIAHIFGKKFYYKKTLSGDIKYCRNTVYFNNYDTTLSDTIVTLEKDIANQQLFQLFNANARFMTNYTDSFHFNYDIDLNYDYFNDIDKNYEHAPAITGKLFNKFRNRDYLVGGDVKAVYFDRNNDTINNTAIRINPWIGAYDNKWKVIVGCDMNVDIVNNKTEYYWYQQIKLQYNISENILLPYAGYSGKLEINNYKKIAFENPFIKPGLYVKNTDHKFLYAGIRGNISSNISFNLKANHSFTINDMYFFVIDTTLSDRNQFTVVYDDVKLTALYGEISIEKSEKLNFLIKGNYYQYEMSEEGEIKPWHKPKYKLSFSSKYNIKNKIILNADIFALGMQYAKSYGVDNANKVIVIPQKLQEIIDINVGIEYRYTKILSAFINLNNIAGAKYYKWNYYPIQRFNLLAGVTYAFN